MTWLPIAGLPPQFSKNAGGASASGYWLKFYSESTTTPISMATDDSGGTTLIKSKLNARGEPLSNPSDEDSVFIPFLNQNYKAALFLTEADADANNTASALWVVDELGLNGVISALEAADEANSNNVNYFESIVDMVAGTTVGGQTVTHSINNVYITLGFYAVNDGGGATYVVGNTTADGYSVISLGDGFTAALQIGAAVNIKQFGATADGSTDDTNVAQALLDFVKNNGCKAIFNGGTIMVTGLTATGSNYVIEFTAEAVLKNVDGVEADTIEVTGNGIRVIKAKIDGNGSTMSTTGGSYTGLFLKGYNNKAIDCEVYSCGKYLTTGNMGADSTQQCIGSISSDANYPNYVIRCVGRDAKNYGLSIRSNTIVFGGSYYDNGTNGIGARLSENILIDGTKVGTQKQDNATTITNGIYFDKEVGAVSPPNSSNIKLINVTVEAQEGRCLTSTRYNDMTITSCRFKGDVFIQATKPVAAEDLGTFSAVKLTDVRIDGELLATNMQKISMTGVECYGTGAQAFECDSIDVVVINGVETKSEDAQLIRCDKVEGNGYIGVSRLLLNTIPDINLTGINIDRGASISDQVGIGVTNVQGKILGKLKNCGAGIICVSSCVIDCSGFEFENFTASDGSFQNAAINFNGATGCKMDNLKFKNVTNRTIYIQGCDEFTLNSGQCDGASSGTLNVGGSSDKFTFTGWTINSAMVISITAGSSMTGSEVNANHISSSATLTNYPAGPTRYNSGSLEVWNGSAWV